ncbi:alpha-L-rhamnosidase [Kibdelosporangium banguiense]|uniref:alpha-L-rhamnosidase n=1 Tax=Kibdelosporangium banguiense TaxID=1365924 RepID=A0ABS4U1Y5_9PSEU|nr:family 78 glycoside hydrolase catalytic domain [Kibdelosporangium banguiense]MBP2330678.1 alpha-L-rhamnosidase [Kibdelosporangium banguiense]
MPAYSDMSSSGLRVDGLSANGRVDPVGIDGRNPSLGWRLASSERAVVQRAYEIRVGRAPGANDVWSSGKVLSARQVDVAYEGPALKPATRYYWSVRAWNGRGVASPWSADAFFETGLLTAADWGGAQWIARPRVDEVDKWTDYVANVDFKVDNAALGVFLRASDANNGYMWQVSVVEAQPTLRPHRKVNGGYTLLGSVNLASFGFTNDQLRTGRHTIRFDVVGSTIKTTLDGVLVDTRSDSTFAKGYLGFRVHDAAKEQGTVYDAVVTRPDGTVLLDTDFPAGRNPFAGGELTGSALVVSGTTDALYDPNARSMPLLRKSFDTVARKKIASARVYASGLGLYRLTINGKAVGDQLLTPGWTDYNKRIQSQTYDATALLGNGGNVIGAALAEGWWAGKVGIGWSRQYGDTPALVAKLRIVYTDGSVQWIDTDGSWKVGDGPFVRADLQDGETYDARLEPAGWNRQGFNDANWLPAANMQSKTALLVPQTDEPVRATEVLPARKMTEPTPGAYVYDLGQNMVGVSRLKLTGQAGQTVRIRYAEVLNKNGTLYTDNFRTAKVTDRYVFAGSGTVTYEPTFTQHGFRYIEITGVSTPPALADVKGVVWGSNLRPTGTLRTSDGMLNQLVSNISWSQRGNFLSIPTDTPARDERLGWTGDISLFAPTANYLVDTRAFLSHWMADVRTSQHPNGDLPAVVPSPQGVFAESGVGWSDVMITVPYSVWRAYGDVSILRENYDAMKKFFAFTRNSAGPDLLEPGRTTFFTNDWLNLNDPTVQGVIGTAYYAENARMMAESAQVLGDAAAANDYKALSADIRRAFTQAYVAADGTVAGNSQTGYAMALAMHLVSDQSLIGKVGEKFVAKLARTDFHLTTGFIGTPLLLPSLSIIGRDDLAYKMLLHKDYPSWGYEVANGATTMWERWNSIMPDGSFGPVDMNSFNHYAYGAVGDWMFQNIGGLSALEPGYKRSRIAPAISGGLTEGSGQFDSVYGRLSSSWKAHDGTIDLNVTVPVNTTAEVHVPTKTRWAVTEGGRPAATASGVRFLRMEDGAAVFEVGSGSYSFGIATVLGGIGEATDATKQLCSQLGRPDALIAQWWTLQMQWSLESAWNAYTIGKNQAAAAEVHQALARVGDLRRWTAFQLSRGRITAAEAATIQSLLDRIDKELSQASGLLLGAVAKIELPTAEWFPGSTIPVTIAVTNGGTDNLASLATTLAAPAGWDVRPPSGKPTLVRPGQTARLQYAVRVPTDAVPGTVQLQGTVRYDYRGSTASLPVAASPTVQAPVTVASVALSPTKVQPGDALTASVKLTNRTTVPFKQKLTIETPTGWTTPPAVSYDIAAGATVTVPVKIDVPLTVTQGAATIAATIGAMPEERGSATATVELVNPPPNIVDHVDLGDTASETAHGLTASPSSGVNTEAGLTRRYTNNSASDGWFEIDLNVPAGKPFVIRAIETYDSAQFKTYDVTLDGKPALQRRFQRTESGNGTVTYQFLVQPSADTADGKVRLRFQDAPGDYDPSIADVWSVQLN